MGDRRERYQGPADIAAKADGEDEAATIATAARVLELGVAINAVNKDGDTALHVAAALALTEVIQFLVESGASLEAKNGRGMTALGAVNARPERGTQGAFLYGLLTADGKERTSSFLRRLGAKE